MYAQATAVARCCRANRNAPATSGGRCRASNETKRNMSTNLLLETNLLSEFDEFAFTLGAKPSIGVVGRHCDGCSVFFSLARNKNRTVG